MHGTKQQGPQSAKGPAQMYRDGLAALDKHCQASYSGKRFADLADADKDTVLKGIESGSIKLDPADGAFLGLVTANHTVEPTVTANSRVAGWAANQRATNRWVAFPGQVLVYPATNVAGFALRAKSPGYTGTAVADAIIANC